MTNIFLGEPPAKIKQFIIEHYGPSEPDWTKIPLTFTAEEAGAKLILESINGPTVTLETSPTGEEGSWTPHRVGDEIILANVGDKVMFRNSSDNIQVMGSHSNSYNSFDIRSGNIAASGNIMFLMDKTGELRDLSGMDYCYSNIFSGCSSLTQAPVLPATTLAGRCYENMFFSCSSLTQAPVLPATTLSQQCYYNTFAFCDSIPEPKYNMPNLTFDEVSNEIQNTVIFNYDSFGSAYEVQCSDKILVAKFSYAEEKWKITEK